MKSILDQARQRVSGGQSGNPADVVFNAGRRAAEQARAEANFWRERGVRPGMSPNLNQMVKDQTYGEALVVDDARRRELNARAQEREDRSWEIEQRNRTRKNWSRQDEQEERMKKMMQSPLLSSMGAFKMTGGI